MLLPRLALIFWRSCGLLFLASVTNGSAPGNPDDVFPTYGVHNDSHPDRCARANCLYSRNPGEPSDPLYPPYWSSRWVMYRVYNHYQDAPPPYDKKPPAPLVEGHDYEATWGTSFYDSTWVGPTGTGAMEEDYEKACLPIFPIANHYSCSIISLGALAYFVTYDDRPSWMPPVCLFSPRNPPPTRDFIKHLPYSATDSERLQKRVQAYGFWTAASGRPMQVGVSPDQTQSGGVMFGYAFDSQATPDRVDASAAPYRHPNSFYFSGMPYLPQAPLPNAPIISQNYTNFAMIKPIPAKTWAKVQGIDPASLPKCQLFNPPKTASDMNSISTSPDKPSPASGVPRKIPKICADCPATDRQAP
jgi:hypothetical protein